MGAMKKENLFLNWRSIVIEGVQILRVQRAPIDFETTLYDPVAYRIFLYNFPFFGYDTII